MDDKIETFCDLKKVKLSFNSPSKSWDSNLIHKFLQGSKELLKQFLQDAILSEQCSPHLCEWYSVLTSVVRIQFDRSGCSLVDLEMMLSFLNHIIFYLIKLKGICYQWLSYLGNAVFAYLSRYRRTESFREDFALAIAQKSYSFLCSAGQTMVKEAQQTKRTDGSGYELCLLGCAFLNFDPSKTGQSALNTAKNFLSSLNHPTETKDKAQSSKDTKLQSRLALFRHALLVYCSRPCSFSESECLYFVEIFRLVMNCPDLRKNFLNCDGNLFNVDLEIAEEDGFPCDEARLLQKQMGVLSQTDYEANIEKLKATLSICRLIDCVKSLETKLQTIKSKGKDLEEMEQMEEHVHQLLSHLQQITSQNHPRMTRAPQLLTESLSLLVANPPDFHSTPTLTLHAYHQLLSHCLEIFSRDTLAFASDSKLVKSYNVNRLTYNLAVLNRDKMQALQQLATRSDFDDCDLPSLAMSIKSNFNYLCVLAQTTKKKALLAPDTSAYKQIFKTLNSAFTFIGSVGRSLRRLDKQNAIIVLLSPLWPVSTMPELLPSLNYHECLCDAYRTSGNITAACQVIAHAAFMDCSLVTSPILRLLVKMAKSDANLKIHPLFSRCEDQGVEILIQFVKMATHYRNSTTVSSHVEMILRHVLSTNQLSPSDEALANLLLAESCWYDPWAGEVKDKPDTSKETLELLHKSLEWYNRDEEKVCGDLYAQTLFLEAEILHSIACLTQADFTKYSSNLTSDDEANGETSEVTSVPGLSSEVPADIAPQTPLEGRSCTPSRFAMDSFQTPAAAPSRTAVKIKPKKLNMERPLGKEALETASSLPSDRGNLLNKAHIAFAEWKAWFSGSSSCLKFLQDSSQKTKDEKCFRAERSFAFLEHLAQVAIVHHQPVLAIDCLSQAHLLASAMERTHLLTDIKLTLLPLLGKLGLVPSTSSEVTRKGEGVSRNEEQGKEAADVLASLEEELAARVPEKDKDGDGVNLVPMAAYYYTTNKFDKCLVILQASIKHIEDLKQKGPLTVSTILAIVESKRLLAEISSSPRSVEALSVTGLKAPYPLDAVVEAVKYITSVAVFSMGADFKKASGRGVPLNSWHLIHEYLSTINLCSQLFMAVGNVKFARTYLQEGLKLSYSCLLDSWRGVFLSALSHISLHGFDCISDAQDFVKKGFETLSGIAEIPHDEDDDSPVELTADEYCDGLLTNETYWSPSEQECDKDCDLCSLHPQLSAFNPTLIKASIELLWTRAELTLQDSGNKPKALSLLHSAVKLSSHLNKNSVSEFVQTLADTVVTKTSMAQKDVHSSQLLLLETILKIAQVSFQALFTSLCQTDVNRTKSLSSQQKREVLKIRQLCQVILERGKTLVGMGKARIIMASAQLLQIQLNYLPCWCEEGDNFMDDREEEEEVEDDLSEAVQELKMEEDYWNGERLRKLKTGSQEESGVTPNTSSHTATESIFEGSLKSSSKVSLKPKFTHVKSKKSDEQTPSQFTTSEGSPQKRKSPICDLGIESTSLSKSSKQQSVAKTAKKSNTGSRNTQSGSTGGRPAGRARQSKPLPILSLGASHGIYDENEEETIVLLKPTSTKELGNPSPPSQIKKPRAGKQKKSVCKEQSPVLESPSSPGKQDSGSDLSPLSREFAELNMLTSPEECQKERKAVRSQRGTLSKQETDISVKPAKRTGRGKTALKAQDINRVETLLESSPSANGILEIKNKGRVKGSKGVNSFASEPNNTTAIKQTRRRRKTPEVDSPEKKREIDEQGEYQNSEFYHQSSRLPHQLFPSPVFSSINGTGEHWSGEDQVDKRFYSQRGEGLIDEGTSNRLPDTLGESTSPRVPEKPTESFHSPVIHNLWSPVENPRGRPRKVRQEREELPAGCTTQSQISKGKKRSPETVNRVERLSTIETALGGDDDGDKENTRLSEDEVDCLKSDQPRHVKINKRTGQSKLSLRKNKTKNNNIASEKEERKPITSLAEVIWGSDDEDSASGNSIPMGEKKASPKSVSPSESKKVVNDNDEPEKEKTVTKLARRGQKKEKGAKEEHQKREVKSIVRSLEADRMQIDAVAESDDESALCGQDRGSSTDLLHRVMVKFLTASPDERLEMHIRQSLDELKSFPPSFLYSQLSRWLALCHWNRSLRIPDEKPLITASGLQSSIAALLTDSLHVSFYHMLTRNLHHKLRKCRDNTNLTGSSKRSKKTGKKEEAACEWSSLAKEEVEREMTLLSQVLEMSRREQEAEGAFETRLGNLPQGWTVVQISLVNFDVKDNEGGQILITRMTSDLQSLTVGIPVNRWKYLTRVMRVYKKAIDYDVRELSPGEYWTCRFKRDKDMKDLVYLLQEQVLSGHKWLLCGRPKYLNQSISDVLDKAVDSVVQQLGQMTVDGKTVRVVLEILLSANEKDVDSVLQSLWPSSIAKVIASTLWEVQLEVSELEQEEQGSQMERNPVILLLDKVFNQLPWECMPILSEDTITRVPSLAALESLLTLHAQRPDSPFQTGVGRQKVVAVIDPETNLQNSVNVLLPQFQKYKGWTCLTQQEPTVSDLKAFLKQELYIYNGHGWGRKFLGGDDLQMFRAKAVAIIMGCHSGQMAFRSRTDGDGAPLYFLLAGCPTVLGNLWLVTDKDIDKLTSHMMSYWMSCQSSVPLSHVLNQARKVCKLQGLNGFAPVIYGLPVLMN